VELAKKVIILAFAFLCFASLFAKAENYYSPITENELNNQSLGLEPGDTLWLESGEREYLSFWNFCGDSLKPIVIKSKGEVVIHSNNNIYYKQGINIKNCKYLVIDGSHEKLNYGIRITKTNIGSGLDIRDLSTNISLEFIEISHCDFAGMSIKDDPDCSGKSWRDSFIMKNIVISNCYIHDTRGEGIYLGSTAYDGSQLHCDYSGTSFSVNPHLLDGVTVSHNKIENTGREGLQLFSSINAEVYNNSISNYGLEREANHASGLLIGLGTSAKVYNNKIDNGFGHGIYLNGDGNCYLYNNLITNSGIAKDSQNIMAAGIYVDARRIANHATHYTVTNNTIVKTKNNGIRLVYFRLQKNITLYNNLIGEFGNGSHVYSQLDQIAIYPINRLGIDEFGNYYSKSLDSLYLTNNYSPTKKSGAINCGRAIKDFKINTDINGNKRNNGQIDAGAFEYEFNNIVSKNTIGHCRLIVPEGVKEINGNLIEHNAGDTFCLMGGYYKFIVISNFSSDVVFTPIYKSVDVSGMHVGLILKNNANITISKNNKYSWNLQNIFGNGIDIKNTESVTIKDVHFNKIGNNAVNNNNGGATKHLRVNHCTFNFIEGNGILLKENYHNNELKDVHLQFEKNHFEHIDRSCIETDGYFGSAFLSQNTFNGLRGIRLLNVEKLVIQRNYFETMEYAIELENNLEVDVYSNIFKQHSNINTSEFIHIRNSSGLPNTHLTINNNTLHFTGNGYLTNPNAPFNNSICNILNNLIIDESGKFNKNSLTYYIDKNLIIKDNINLTVPNYEKGVYYISSGSIAHNSGFNLNKPQFLDYYGQRSLDFYDFGAIFLNAPNTPFIVNDSFFKDSVEFSVFPVPANAILNYELKNTINPKIEIINSNGKICDTLLLNNDNGIIDLGDLKNGIYIIRLIDGSEIKTIKLSKQH
jgi:parallel beta-helix repeat protein